MIRGASRAVVLSAPQAYALGHQLRQVREEQGLTRGQAAVTAKNFFPSWIAQIEGGEIHDLKTMREYARALGARIRGNWAARVRRSRPRRAAAPDRRTAPVGVGSLYQRSGQVLPSSAGIPIR